MVCVNHGDQLEEGVPPDSVCGNQKKKRSIDGCKFHSGHLEKGVFTCCQGGADSEGCQQGQHRTAQYPEPEAKLYFYPKPIINPGIKYKITDKKEEPNQQFNIGEQICKCDYFKKISVPYKPITNNSNITDSEAK